MRVIIFYMSIDGINELILNYNLCQCARKLTSMSFFQRARKLIKFYFGYVSQEYLAPS
jgi:hypothetical protein